MRPDADLNPVDRLLARIVWRATDPGDLAGVAKSVLSAPYARFADKLVVLRELALRPSDDSVLIALVTRHVLTKPELTRQFLAQMDSPAWLKLAIPEFEKIARDGPPVVRRALALTVARVCENEPEVALSLLRLLWATDEPPVGWACVEIISQLGLWEDVEDLLEPVNEQHAVGLSFMPFALARAAGEGQVTVEFATKWLAKWTLSQMRVHPMGGPHFRDSLKHAFGKVVEKDPASVLPYAVELVEANCEAGDQLGDERYGLKDTDLRVHLQFRIGVRGSREEPAFVVLTALLQLAESERCPMAVRDVVGELLASEYLAARAIAINVCRANPKKFIPQCVTALTDSLNMVYPLDDLSRPLLSEAYHLLPQKKRKEVDEILLSLASTTEGEGYEGISRLYALKSIPEEYWTDEVEAEIERLQEHLGEREVPPEPEMQVSFQPSPVSDIAKQIDSMTVEQVIELLHKTENSDAHDLYDVGQELRRRAEDNSEFAVQLAGELASATSLANRYAEELLLGIRKAHTWDRRMEVIWRLRQLDDSGVHGIAADIIEQSAPHLSSGWVRRARLLLCRWATDSDPAATGGLNRDLLTTGINSARGRVAEALLRIAGEHGLTDRSSEVLRALAEDKSPAVRACVLAKLGHLRRDHYHFSLGLFKHATECEDDSVLQYTIWYARSIESKDYQRYVEPVIRRAVQSAEKEVARVGGVLVAWGLIEPQQGSPELEGILVDTHSAAVIGGAEEVFSSNVCNQNEAIAQTSRKWCLRLMQSGGPDIAHSVVGGLLREDPIDLESVLDILLVAAESNDEDTILNVLQVLEKGVKQSPNEAAEVLSKLWSRQTSGQIVPQLYLAEMLHKVLDELLRNDEVTVANRQLAWDIFDALLAAGDMWAVGKFDEYVRQAAVQ